MKKAIERIFNISVLILASVCMVLSFDRTVTKTANAAKPAMVDSGRNYTESLSDTLNPERGFYKALTYIIDSAAAGVPYGFSSSNMQSYKNEGHNIVHLRFGLERFSSNAYYNNGGGYVTGTSQNLTTQALDNMRAIFNNVRSSGQTSIIRFSYNAYGLSEADVGKSSSTSYLNAEPTLATMTGHIGQLGAIFSEYADVISCVEAGFLGPWGEMHSTTMTTDANCTALLNKFVEVVPRSRNILVRNPGLYVAWYNAKNGTSYTRNTMKNITVTPGTPEAQIGMFNDGYMGTATDWGTFLGASRENESTWLANQTQYTFYGGECITDRDGGAPSYSFFNNYNKIEFFAWEAFLTHTTYLNIAWNNNLIDEWKVTPYRVGTLSNSYPEQNQSAVLDTLYSNAGKTAFEYIQNHLGYRLVLRQAKNSGSVPSGSRFYFEGKIENVGFGNIVNKKNAYVIFSSSARTYMQKLDIDPNSWKSSGGVIDFSFDTLLANDTAKYDAGTYKVYLKINDEEEKNGDKVTSTLRTIRFANNDATMWNATLGANLVGSVSIGTAAQDVTAKIYDYDRITVLDTFTMPHGSVLNTIDYTPDASKTISGKTYNFTGWENFTSGMVLDEDISFYAKYALVSGGEEEEEEPEPIPVPTFFTITFKVNGGGLAGGALVQIIEKGKDAVPPTLTRTGYTFDGWDSDVYLNVTANADITAKWKKTVTTEPPAEEVTPGGDEDETKGGCFSKSSVVSIFALSGLMLIFVKFHSKMI